MWKTLNLTRKTGNLAKYSQARLGGRLDGRHRPLEIFVEVTNRCNICCIMCARPEEYGVETGELSEEHIDQMASIFPHAMMLHAYGFGEPLMNRHFFHLLESAKRSHLFVDFFTNGMALTEERSQRVVDLGVDRIIFSIDGATSHTFEFIRQGAKFDRVMTNLSQLNEERKRKGREHPVIHINFVATATNFHEIPELTRLAGELGVSQISVKPLVTYDDKPHLELLRRAYRPEVDDPIIEEARRNGSARGVLVDVAPYTATRAASDPVKAPAAPTHPSAKPMCFQPWKTMYVRWNGQVKTCCFAVSPILGDLREKTLRQIWMDEPYRSLREQVARGAYPPDCNHCLHFNLMPTHDDAHDIFRLICADIGRARKAIVKARSLI